MKFCNKEIQSHLLRGGKITRKNSHLAICLDDGKLTNEYGFPYPLGEKDLKADDWQIVKIDYDWNKIIKDKVLCVFWDYGDATKVYGTLEYVDDKNKFVSREYCSHFDYCRLFDPTKFNIAKNIKEYMK